MRDVTNQTFDEIDVGASATIARTLTQTDVEALALAAGDVEGFHLEGGSTDADARSAQGAAAIAIVAGLLNRRLPGPGTAIVATAFRYQGACHAGDTLTATVTAKARDVRLHRIDFECRCTNQNGDVLVEGTATVDAPTSRIAYADVATPEMILRRNDAFGRRSARSCIRAIAIRWRGRSRPPDGGSSSRCWSVRKRRFARLRAPKASTSARSDWSPSSTAMRPLKPRSRSRAPARSRR